jgi:CheY-like chemotaxis protein
LSLPSATQVLTIIADESFDLLLTDIGMPDQDGYSLIEAIRKKPAREGGKIPALAVTGSGRSRTRARRRFDQHIAKPLGPAALIQAVADLLAIGRV